MTTRTPSQQGRYQRNKGATFEADLARYLRQWWPGACRAVRAGSSAAPDPGDIANVPGVVWSAKCVAGTTASKPSTWTGWWAELDAMLANDPAALGIIVEKRVGHGDPADAWAHLRLDELVRLVGHRLDGGEPDPTPVRIRLERLVGLLVEAGYTRSVAS
jgi:hypothetical protein